MPRRKSFLATDPGSEQEVTDPGPEQEVTDLNTPDSTEETPEISLATPSAGPSASDETPALPLSVPPKAVDREIVITAPGTRLVRVRFERSYDGENGNLVLRFHQGDIAQLPQHVVQALKRRPGLITVLE